MQPQRHGGQDPILGSTHPDTYYQTMKDQAVKVREARVNREKLVDIFDPQEELHAAHDEQLMKELQQTLVRTQNAGTPGQLPDRYIGPTSGGNLGVQVQPEQRFGLGERYKPEIPEARPVSGAQKGTTPTTP